MTKRKHRRRLRPAFKAFLAIVVLLTIFAGYRTCSPKKTADAPAPSPASASPEASSTPFPTPEVHTASLFLMGDIMCQRPIVYQAEQPDGSFDFAPMFDDVLNQVSKYDLAFGNMETILGGDYLGFTGFPHFNAPQAFGDYMVSKGFNLISLANNHMLDKGEEGALNSLKYWAGKTNVVTAGMFDSFDAQNAIPVHEINGITYAFNAWTYGMNGNLPPQGEEYLVNCYRDDPEKMLQWVRDAKTKADLVIVSMHWGTEYTAQPDDEQLQLAQELADAGADLIIGNHAHNIQPIQWLNDGKTLCFYALGNGISDQDPMYDTDPDDVLTAMEASVQLVKDENGARIENPRADLLYTCREGDRSDNYHEGILLKEMKNVTVEELPDVKERYQNRIDTIVHAYDASIPIGLN